eukprot:7584485-Prorocentrum_lima.AAC.1
MLIDASRTNKADGLDGASRQTASLDPASRDSKREKPQCKSAHHLLQADRHSTTLQEKMVTTCRCSVWVILILLVACVVPLTVMGNPRAAVIRWGSDWTWLVRDILRSLDDVTKQGAKYPRAQDPFERSLEIDREEH